MDRLIIFINLFYGFVAKIAAVCLDTWIRDTSVWYNIIIKILLLLLFMYLFINPNLGKKLLEFFLIKWLSSGRGGGGI